MNTISAALLTGCISFIATNIDDIFILAAFYSQSVKRTAYIVVGQYIGMCVLIVLSVVGAWGSLSIPRHWIGFFGIIPVYMGVRMFYTRDESPPIRRPVLTDLNTYKVMFTVIGNGADNLGVYIPMFMQGHWFYKAIVIIVFLIFTGLWCLVAYKVVHNPWIGRLIQKFGSRALPIVLIGIGGYIMLQSGSFAFLAQMIFRR